MTGVEPHPVADPARQSPPRAVTIRIESCLDQVRFARAALVGVLREMGVGPTVRNQLQLAVAEVLSNTIEHGYKLEPGHTIEASIGIHDSVLRIAIEDYASAMPPEVVAKLSEKPGAFKAADVGWPSRGHGLRIVRHLVDEISCARHEGTNVLTLQKKIRLRQAMPLLTRVEG